MGIYNEIAHEFCTMGSSKAETEENYLRAICALADEIRAQRLQDREFYEADRAEETEATERRASEQKAILEQMVGMRQTIQDMPPTQTHIMVPNFPPPPLAYADFAKPVTIPRCECEHGIAAHSQPGTACDLCDCKTYRTHGGKA